VKRRLTEGFDREGTEIDTLLFTLTLRVLANMKEFPPFIGKNILKLSEKAEELAKKLEEASTFDAVIVVSKLFIDECRKLRIREFFVVQ